MSISWLWGLCCLLAAERLPLPEPRLPDYPPLPAMVVTPGGQRLALAQTDVTVTWREDGLQVNRPGWWVINYPLERLAGRPTKDDAELRRLLFGRPEPVANWYVKTPGPPAPEPPVVPGPPPFEPTAGLTTLVVSQHPAASDEHPGTIDQPLRTIQAAINRARPGDVIQVRYGVYRETVRCGPHLVNNELRGTYGAAGTATEPIRLEGIPAPDGRRPVICGNDLFADQSFQPAPGRPGVWRAPLFTNFAGPVSVSGEFLEEVSFPDQLRPGTDLINLGTVEYLTERIPADARPASGEEVAGRTWRRQASNAAGALDLAAVVGAAKAAVVYAAAYVWVDPDSVKATWDPRFPEPITGRLEAPGGFRSGRMNGSDVASQLNRYQLTVNGERVPSIVRSRVDDSSIGRPRPWFGYGVSGDRIDDLRLRQGWNVLLFKFDTSLRPDKLTYRFNLPAGVKAMRVAPDRPADETAGQLPLVEHITDWLVLGPFESTPDRAVYLRLVGDDDPNSRNVDLAARGELLMATHPHLHIRGFEFRGGSQFQQRAQVTLGAPGVRLENCWLHDGDGGAVNIANQTDQNQPPVVCRFNVMERFGHKAIGLSQSSERLTATNQNEAVPGRGPVLIEFNRIREVNWLAWAPFWDSGAMKVFRMTGTVIRGNDIADCDAPGIWLDWEHFNNRLEANRIERVFAFGIGVEASPGPNLIANNVVRGIGRSSVWFRYAYLSWSSDRNWLVNNTADQLGLGTGGIYLHEGGDDRRTRWVPVANRRMALVGNLLLGADDALRSRPVDQVEANFSDIGQGDLLQCLSAAAVDDRGRLLDGDSPLYGWGSAVGPAELVTHDHLGLLRFPDQPRSVGAYRRDPVPAPGHRWALIEVEYPDGTMRRLYDTAPFTPARRDLLPEAVERWPLVAGSDGAWRVAGYRVDRPAEPTATTGLDPATWQPATWQPDQGWRLDDQTLASFAGDRVTLAARTRPRPVVIFRAPRSGRWVIHVQNGKLALWAGHQQLAVNLVKVSTDGRAESLEFHRTDQTERRLFRTQRVVDLAAGDEVALILGTNATSGGGGAVLEGYRIEAGRLGE